MSRSKHLSFAVLSSFNASGLIMLRTRINVKCFSRESQVTRICNSNLNLSLTDVESEYPVQCSEDCNWRIPTENDDRTDTEGITSQHAMCLLVIMSSPHHSVVTKEISQGVSNHS